MKRGYSHVTNCRGVVLQDKCNKRRGYDKRGGGLV